MLQNIKTKLNDRQFEALSVISGALSNMSDGDALEVLMIQQGHHLMSIQSIESKT